MLQAQCVSSEDASYHLSDAILLYRQRGQFGNDGNVIFASAHEVKVGSDGKPSIEAGVAVSKSGLVEMFKTLNPEDFVKPTLLDSRVLAIGSNHLVWYCKPQKREVWFKCKVLGEVHGKADLPGLVFMVMGNKWHVFAVKGNRRPTAGTPLYAASFYNVWSGGGICTGNIDIPKGQARFSPDAWEESFFRSYFTHPGNRDAEPATKYRGGLVKLWGSLLKGRAFPTESLVPMEKTLGQVFDRLVARLESGR